MKAIAFYLPQFHQTPENDKWWEKGFTEWTNVKRARAVYRGQTQPKVPLNDNYYNLLDKKTVEWQTKLMHKYGVYGFCYFHYWFTGKKLLYRPAENLLKWKEIDQPFCFAWANVTWARTWTAYSGATTDWNCVDRKAAGSGVLLEQEYGTEQDWIEHYEYLRSFFGDSRYIKVDNKPVFLIYHVEYIKYAKKMLGIWNELARQDGFNGIHLVSMNTEISDNAYVEAVVRYGQYGKYDRHYLREAGRLLCKFFNIKTNRGCVLSYKKVWENMIKEAPADGLKTYPGGVVTYDETPRKGKNAVFLRGATPELFEQYIKEQIKKAELVYQSEFIFIDAWNEWGEGNYLEPDQEHGYAYLEALSRALDGEGNECLY